MLSMDLSSNNFLEPSPLFSSDGCESINRFCKTSLKNPFLDSFPDPVCKLNLKENSEFVKSFPEISAQRNVEKWAKRNVIEAPATPGRPVFSFSNGSFARKSVPSKWDDAEKWLVSGSSCHDSPANNNHGLFRSMESSRMFHKPHNGEEIFAEKSRVTEEKVSKVVSAFEGPPVLDYHTNRVSLSATADVLLKDKFTDDMSPMSLKFGCSETLQEGFLFDNSLKKSLNHTTQDMVKHRDIGTEMTPLGSSTTSRCPTPFLSTSPARHNTPANRSGPLAPDSSNAIDMAQLQECHLAKLNLGTQFDSIPSNWSSREEEEEDVSRSLRHCEMNVECRKSVSESRYCGWEEEEKTKSCLRYQREEAKIEAWVNLQSAKAEAESRKLEVKIQKIRSNFEEKLMKRMADVHRKAEEWRATAQFQHSEQIRRVDKQAKKMMNRNKLQLSGHKSCGCFPCNNQTS